MLVLQVKKNKTICRIFSKIDRLVKVEYKNLKSFKLRKFFFSNGFTIQFKDFFVVCF